MAYYPLSLERRVNKIWKKHKTCKKLKRRKFFVKPLQNILARILENSRRIKTLESVYNKYKTIEVLDVVIGNDYFGTSQNRKRFYYLVNKITTQSRYECVYVSSLSEGYNIKDIPWLKSENLDEKNSKKTLQNTNKFLLQYVVKPLVKHFYHPLKNYKGYEIKFVKRQKWHSFERKVVNELLQSNFLVLKTNVNKYQSRGELKLFPKTTCDSLEYRPIIYPKRQSPLMKTKLKRLNKNINMLANSFSKIGNGSLFDRWACYSAETKGQTIYGVKLDIKDAFGYVNIDTICSIIRESNFNISDKQFIINRLQHQYVTFQKRLYHWKHGLLQGDSLSSSLCNLFISNFEKKNLQDFFGCLLHRTVDDYFFCSLQKDDTDKFENKVKSVFQLNESKTQKTSSSSYELSYLGQIFNLHSRQVSKEYTFNKEYSIRHKFKLWDEKKPISETHNIVAKALQFPSNNHCFKRLEINCVFNTRETVLKNYFHGMIYVAFKFHIAVMAIREFKQEAKDMPFLSNIIERVVHEYSGIIFIKIQRNLHHKYITIKLLRNIAYRSFILVLKKNNEFYKNLVKHITETNNLYLHLDNFCILPKFFNTIPEAFSNICTSRRSAI